MNKYIYFHICMINNWKEVVGNIFQQLKDSGLYDDIKEIRCSVIGDDLELLKFLNNDKKISIIFAATDSKFFAGNYRLITDYREDESRPIHNEEIILNKMWEDAQKEDFYVLYLHSKGVKKFTEIPNQKSNIEDWVNLMLYFNLYYFRHIEMKLKEFDAVGVNLEITPKSKKSSEFNIRFSGNFWWSKSEHIRQIQKKIPGDYGGPENWISYGKNIKFLSLWNSYTDHYQKSYRPYWYEGHGTKDIVVEYDVENSKIVKNDLSKNKG